MEKKEVFCPKCGDFYPFAVKQQEETYPVKGEDVSISADVCFCSHCGEEVWHDELDDLNLKKAYKIYCQRHGLLSPEEIRHIREKYNVSQTTFARILGFGDKTITRYENGNIPDKAQNNLIALCVHPDNFKELLEKSQVVLSETEYEKITGALNSLTVKILMSPNHDVYTVDESCIKVSSTFWGGRKHA